MLSLLLLVPLLGTVCVTLLPAGATADSNSRRAALLFGWVQLVLTLWIATTIDWSKGGVQLAEDYSWPLMTGIELAFGVDGLSGLLLLIVAIGFLVATHRGAASQRQSAASLLSLACLSLALSTTNLLPMLAAWQLLMLLSFIRIHQPPNADGVLHAAAPNARRYLVISQAAMAGLLLTTAVYFHASGTQGIEPSAEIFDLQSQAGSWRFMPKAENAFAFPLWTLSLQLVCIAALFGLFPFHRLPQSSTSNSANAVLHGPDPLPTLIAGYALIRVVLPLASDQVALAAPWMIAWGVGATIHALFGFKAKAAAEDSTAPPWTAAVPAVAFTLFGAAALTADQAAGRILLDLGIFVMIANVLALPLIRRQAEAATMIRALAGGPLVALVVLYFTSPGIEATLRIVRRTIAGEDLD